MTVPHIAAEISSYLQDLSQEQQQLVLGFVRSLASESVRGTPGRELVQFAGSIDDVDLELMTKAIDE